MFRCESLQLLHASEPNHLTRAGHGLIKLTFVAGSTAITNCRANSPLKLLSPRCGGDGVWIFASTYGGGLVGGDSIRIDVEAGAGTRCLLSTQASTKVYRSDVGCTQVLNASVASGAIVVSAPDPVVCYDGAAFDQRQRFDVAQDAGIVMVDWMSSGRKARGERWAFRRFRSSTEVFVERRCIFRDVLLLDPVDGPIGGDMRMGQVDCFATAVIVGAPLKHLCDAVLGYIAEQPASGDGQLIFSASAIAGGAVVRVAGPDAESVGQWLHQRLGGVQSVLGQDPWTRKW